MNKQVKEQLQNLLDIIDKLCERQEYDWFKKELIKRFGGNDNAAETSSVLGSVQVERINNIESYLALDREIDDRESLIDYSFIQDKNVREQLIQDNREMRRIRYSLRGHKFDFYEYCRYALLQIEMMLNYYYFIADKGDIDNINKRIQNNNSYYKKYTSNTLSAIPITYKFWAFYNEHEPQFTYYDYTKHFTHICNVRNEVSHRCPKEDEEDINKYKQQLEKWGYPLTSAGLVKKGDELSKEMQKQYDERLKDSSKYKHYKYLIWLNSMPTDHVLGVVKETARVVSKVIATL